MKLIDYARILVRRGWIMLVLAAIAAGSAYAFSTQATPIYRSTQKVLIQPSRADLGLTESTTRLLNSYVEYLNSRFIAEDVITELQLDTTPEQLLSNVTIAADQFRLFIQIDVDQTDGETANRIANQWGIALVEYRNEQNQTVRRESQIDALLQDYPTYSQIRPRPRINAVAGAVLGFLVGGVIIFVLEYLESSIVHRTEDVERVLELPVLAAIPDLEG